MTRGKRFLRVLWPFRWWGALRALVGGSRVHPTAVLLGRGHQIRLGRGVVLGARVRLDPHDRGCVALGPRVWLGADAQIETDARVQIGEGTTVQRRCSLNGAVRIGQGCIFAPNVFISSGSHPFREIPHLPIREQERRLGGAAAATERPVWVQDDCWLGVNAVIAPGVTVGKGSVVGANAVVTHDVPPYAVVAGSPARVIGRRLAWVPPRAVRLDDPTALPYVLDGAPLTAPQAGAGVCLRAGGRLQVAIDAPTRRAMLKYRASHPLRIAGGHAVVELAAGAGRVELSTQPLRVGELCSGSVLEIDVRAGAGTLEVYEVAAVSERIDAH